MVPKIVHKIVTVTVKFPENKAAHGALIIMCPSMYLTGFKSPNGR